MRGNTITQPVEAHIAIDRAVLNATDIATEVGHRSCEVNITTFADVKAAKRSEGNRRLGSNLNSNRSGCSRRAAQVTVKYKLIRVNARSSEVTSDLATNSACQSVAVLSPFISVVSTRNTTRHGSHANDSVGTVAGTHLSVVSSDGHGRNSHNLYRNSESSCSATSGACTRLGHRNRSRHRGTCSRNRNRIDRPSVVIDNTIRHSSGEGNITTSANRSIGSGQCHRRSRDDVELERSGNGRATRVVRTVDRNRNRVDGSSVVSRQVRSERRRSGGRIRDDVATISHLPCVGVSGTRYTTRHVSVQIEQAKAVFTYRMSTSNLNLRSGQHFNSDGVRGEGATRDGAVHDEVVINSIIQ